MVLGNIRILFNIKVDIYYTIMTLRIGKVRRHFDRYSRNKIYLHTIGHYLAIIKYLRFPHKLNPI